MSFNSYGFIFIFFPISFVLYFIFNHFKKYILANISMIVMSGIFFVFGSLESLIIVIFSILLNNCIIKIMKFNKYKKLVLILGIVINVLILLYFKYFDFIIININSYLGTNIHATQIFSVLGISYLTFQQIAFLVDNYRNEVGEYTFLEYCMFVLYYPKILAGPIVYHSEMFPQFRDIEKRKINVGNITKGIYAFSVGMGKKVLIADVFGRLVDNYYAELAGMNTTCTILAVVGYSFQLYFDFSGYCDMATGVSYFFNIELPINFDSPYKSYSISEFWNRWHISLTRFFTKYIYIPLGGSRKGILRTYINVLIVFLVSGIWHGAGWTFLIWGGIHGILSIFDKILKKNIEQFNPVFNWIITFGMVNLAWIFFRAESINVAKSVIYSLIELDFGIVHESLTKVFNTNTLKTFVEILDINSEISNWLVKLHMYTFYIISFILIINFENIQKQIVEFKPTVTKAVFSAIILFWSVLSFAQVTTFIYSGF